MSYSSRVIHGWILLFAFSLSGESLAQEVVSLSADTTVGITSGPVLSDHGIAVDNQLGVVGLENLGALPIESDVVAFGLAANGDRLFALDITTELPGAIFARGGDIVRFDGSSYSIEFSTAAAGLPANVRTDAVSISAAGLLLSFDTTTLLAPGVVAADEDLVNWNGVDFSLVLDGSAVGMDPAWEVDAAQDLGGGHYLVSFDTDVLIGGVPFRDDDVIEFDGSGWSLRYSGAGLGSDWDAADLDAVLVPEPSLLTGLIAPLGLLAGLFRRRTRCRPSPTSLVSLTLLTIASLASSASAADGAFEINQACATGTGCFPGDGAGFPVTISEPGAYRLTGNLTVADENTTAISIATSSVEVDLGGFVISGPSLIGTGDGITQSGFFQRATVRNGSIVGLGRDGVRLGREARVRDITSAESGRDGIVVDRGGIVERSFAYDSSDDGIVAGEACLITDNTIQFVDDNGLVVDEGCAVSRNIIQFSSGFAIVSIGATVGYGANNMVSNNGGSANPQIFGVGLVEIAPNICGFNDTCP